MREIKTHPGGPGTENRIGKVNGEINEETGRKKDEREIMEKSTDHPERKSDKVTGQKSKDTAKMDVFEQ